MSSLYAGVLRWRSATHRGQSILAAGVALGALAVCAVLFLPLSPAYDLDVFLRAGHAALASGHVYPQVGTRAVYSGSSFVYPYFAVWPFVPLSLVSAGLSTVVFICASAAAVVAASVLASDRDAVIAPLVVCTAFTITGLQLGALSPLLFAGTVFLWRLRERPGWFAVLAAPIIASKLFLAPLLAWPLLAGRGRAFAYASGATAAILAAGFALGPISLGDYTRLLSSLGAHEARAGFSLVGSLRGHGFSPLSAQIGVMGIALAVLGAAFSRYRRSGDEGVLFSAGIVASLILTPVLWSHYLVLLAASLLVLGAPRGWFVGLALASWLIAPPHGTNLHLPMPEALESSGPLLALAASALVLAYAIGRSRGTTVRSRPSGTAMGPDIAPRT